jgi:hypothetical protein
MLQKLDEFCKFFDAMMLNYTIKDDKKRSYHRKNHSV